MCSHRLDSWLSGFLGDTANRVGFVPTLDLSFLVQRATIS